MAAKKKTQVVARAQSDPRAPLDAAAFLSAAQRVLAVLRDDLLTRADESPGVTEALKAQWEVEKAAKRTGDPWEVWRRRVVVQVAAAWVLSLVFARTLEDRGLLERNRIAGPGATDSQEQFRGIAPYLSDRDYLLTVFGELSNLPAAKDLFDPAHNPVWKLGPSIDGARALLDLFRAPDPEAPAFRFGQADTRFLGDLYQSLDEETQERFALLQTPHFVESYILDRTLERAITRFGLDDTTLIDPTCGSGHFLLGAFERLVDHRLRKEPGLDVREAARKALGAVYGADINPYAVAIARFRLTLAFLDRGGYAHLAEAPALPLHLVVGDSLLHAPSQAHLGDVAGTSKEAWAGREFALEDEGAAKDVLLRRYAAVVGNPPYITVKDAVLRERYREMYPRSAGGKYSLGAPFTERFFLLARAAGFVGMITANSFMKREFGKKLIEGFLPTVNLDGVVNTSGAYIPGHGTPTVLLFGTHEPKQGGDVLTVLAKRGEPSTPSDPAHGLVWSSVVNHGREVGFEDDYISVARVTRATLEKHPWSLGGGGAAELKELLEDRCPRRLKDLVDDIGFASFTGLDEAFILPRAVAERLRFPDAILRAMVIGEDVRDWAVTDDDFAVAPYDLSSQRPLAYEPRATWAQFLWRYRASLEGVLSFGGKTRKESGDSWWLWYRWQADRYLAPYRIAFAFVSTHNHFVLDRGGKVFNRSAPIVTLKAGATEDDHLALLAYLNSSTACFWMKQVFQPKHSAEHKTHPEPERDRFEHAGTQLARLPVPEGVVGSGELARLAARLVALAELRAASLSDDVFDDTARGVSLEERVRGSWRQFDVYREQMVVLQEEIDWRVYQLFELVGPEHSAPELSERLSCPRGGRPFERVHPRVSFVRRRDHLVPLGEAEIPPIAPLSPDLESLWERRTNALRANESVGIVERALFKRQWRDTDENVDEPSFRRDHDLKRSKEWISRKLETALTEKREPVQARDLIIAVTGRELDEVVAVLGAVDPAHVARIAMEAEAVPFLAAWRHSEAGLEKRAQWERVWHFQRAEDRGAPTSGIDPPPNYEPSDYRDSTFWRLRGKLDAPWERFISYPGCESDEDKEPVYGWAGWNHLKQAIALATLYLRRKQGEAWGKDRLVPMLAGLDELLPWIWQWHPDPTPESGGMTPGQYVADFLSAQCQELGVTLDEVRAWRPESKKNGAGAVKKTRSPKKSMASTEEETP